MAQTNKKLSQRAIKSAKRRHNWALQWCINYERLQASGFAFALVPIFKELYSTVAEQCRNLERHLRFYNCHPGGSAVIFGATVALEEDYQTETADSLKLGLMGPLAGIGDTIQWILIYPIFTLIGAGLAAEGSWLSLPVIILPMFGCFLARWPLFNLGYKKSVSVIENVESTSSFDKLQQVASVLGLTVIGGFIPSILSKIKVTYSYTKEITDITTGELVSQTVSLQEVLDNIVPYLLPIAVVAFAYWMIKIKKMQPLRALLILGGISFLLGVFGIIGA